MTQANIHEYNGTGTKLDDEGEPLNGFYWEILGNNGEPLSLLTGPYASKWEAEGACQLAFDNDDFHTRREQ